MHFSQFLLSKSNPVHVVKQQMPLNILNSVEYIDQRAVVKTCPTKKTVKKIKKDQERRRQHWIYWLICIWTVMTVMRALVHDACMIVLVVARTTSLQVKKIGWGVTQVQGGFMKTAPVTTISANNDEDSYKIKLPSEATGTMI